MNFSKYSMFNAIINILFLKDLLIGLSIFSIRGIENNYTDNNKKECGFCAKI